MGKYTIVRTCGHEENIQIYGPTKDRDSRAEWEAGRLCCDCFKVEEARKHAEENTKAAEAAKLAGLAALAGSDKQVAWAESIRVTMLDGADLTRATSMNVAAANVGTELGNLAIAIVALIDRMKACSSAKWWIDNRADAKFYSWLQSNHFKKKGSELSAEKVTADHLGTICC